MSDGDSVIIHTAKEHPDPCLAAVFMPTARGFMVPVILRSKGSDMWWDLPGGKINVGEDIFTGIGRELREELGIDARPDAYFGSLPHPIRPGCVRHFFGAAYVGGYPRNLCPDEHEDVQLMTPRSAVIALGSRIPEDLRTYMLVAERLFVSARWRTGRPRLAVAS